MGEIELHTGSLTDLYMIDFQKGLTSQLINIIDERIDKLYDLMALLHESYRRYGFGLLFVCQFLFSIRSDWGLPCWIIRLRMAQPMRLSTC